MVLLYATEIDQLKSVPGVIESKSARTKTHCPFGSEYSDGNAGTFDTVEGGPTPIMASGAKAPVYGDVPADRGRVESELKMVPVKSLLLGSVPLSFKRLSNRELGACRRNAWCFFVIFSER